MSQVTNIIYNIERAGQRWQTTLIVDTNTGLVAPKNTATAPQWTQLQHGQCQGCPLTGERTCPIAQNMAEAALEWRTLASFDKVNVSVAIDNHAITRITTTAQQVLSSVVGIIIAASPGCPATKMLKPMVVFHRPFASQEESVYRALANMALFYQLSPQTQTFKHFCLARYKTLHTVNVGLVQRIRKENPHDESLINALINLDTFVKGIIYNVENDYPSLTEIGF